MSGKPLPTVIIPVFNAIDQLNDCLASIDGVSPESDIVVIDDASTDRRIPGLLNSWAQDRPGRKILSNTRNRGFVYSANRGMSETAGDVVLLNSDTLVTPGWLQALVRCLDSDQTIATATPWSNNGEIVSLPEFCIASPVPANAGDIARVIQATGTPAYPEIPTAVGFCMAISRSAIEQVGLFDEKTFGHGYGEENDFCMRVLKQGMRNVLCDDAYVAHVGGSSFESLGMKPGAESMGRLLSKHPAYQAMVEAFIRTDPLAARRQMLVNAIQRAGILIS